MSMTEPVEAPGIWDRMVSFVTRFRGTVLVLAAALTTLTAIISPTIETSSDPTAYLPSDNETVRSWIAMNERFGALHTLMIGLEEPDEPLTSDGLSRVARITDRLNHLRAEGVLLARSLTNVETLQVGSDGTINADLMVPSIPDKPEDLRQLASRILDDMQVPGALISRDLMGYIVLIRLDPRRDSRAVAQLVREAVDEERGPMGAFYFGAPFFTNQVTRQVYAKLPWIVPIFAALLFGMILIRTRSIFAVLLVLFCSGLTLVWWLGFMDLAGYSLTMTSVNGLLLILVLAALVFSRGVQIRLEGGTNPLPSTVMILLGGTVAAFLAVAVFGRLTPVSVPYLARFGEAMAIGGISVAAVGLLAFIPMGSFLSAGLAGKPEPCPTEPDRNRAIALLVAMVLVGGMGSTQLRFAISLDDLFLDSDEVGSMQSFFNRRFGGNEFIQIDVKGNLRDPATVIRLMRLTDLLEGSGVFSDVRSISQVLGFLAHRFNGLHRIPGDGESLNNLWFFLEGSDDVRPLVSDERDEAMLALRVPAGIGATSEDLVSAVKWAIDGSAREPAEVSHLRLDALARQYGFSFPKDRVDESVSAAISPARQSKIRQDRILEHLRLYLLSPESPFEPTGEEWSRMAESIASEHTTRGDTGPLSGVISATPSFLESGMPPSVAGALAAMLVQRAGALDVEMRSAMLTERLFEGMDRSKIAPQAITRSQGVFAELVSAEPPAGKDMKFHISGFPVIHPLVENVLLGGLWTTAAIVLSVCFLFAILVTPTRRRAFHALGEAFVATILTFGLGWFLRIQVDSSSATLYLIPPMMMFFLSPAVHRRGLTEIRRFPVAFALGLSAAPLSLLLTGVLPIMRLGVAMSVGLASVTLMGTISRRLAGPDPQERAGSVSSQGE